MIGQLEANGVEEKGGGKRVESAFNMGFHVATLHMHIDYVITRLTDYLNIRCMYYVGSKALG